MSVATHRNHIIKKSMYTKSRFWASTLPKMWLDFHIIQLDFDSNNGFQLEPVAESC